MKYAVDTNVFIDAFRDTAAEAALLTFLERALPFTFLSAVVMQELAAGARTRKQARELERSVFRPFLRRQRVFAPTTTAFISSGRLLAVVAARAGWKAVRDNPSLLNDALLAASCRERGITLITQDGDFERFAPLLGSWRHVAPWPDLDH
ncbi:MAG TPA: type II toxin-antitoxin system VapC family toxin [Vicinamibacterales bacterium]|nr:type II toxin-antitoxin system VapC family toxin [Vicinamibacterales bacterium]